MSTQSWTSWLLDSYASAVPTTIYDEDAINEENEGPISQRPNLPDSFANASPVTSPDPLSAPSPNSARSSSSQHLPYGPYIKHGRGGAGNFTWLRSQSRTHSRTHSRSYSFDQYPSSTDDLDSINGAFSPPGSFPLQELRQSSLTSRQKAAELAEHLDKHIVAGEDISGTSPDASGTAAGPSSGSVGVDVRKRAAVRQSSLPTSLSQHGRRPKPEYLWVGIGGAGNLALTQSNEVQSPRSISFNSNFSPGHSRHRKRSSIATMESSGGVGLGIGGLTSGGGLSAPMVGGRGRGGVGNYQAADEASKRVEEQKREEEERLREWKTRTKVEAEVETLLKPPEGAWVGEGGVEMFEHADR